MSVELLAGQVRYSMMPQILVLGVGSFVQFVVARCHVVRGAFLAEVGSKEASAAFAGL